MTQFTNQTFDQISLGETVTVAHTVTRDEVELLALVSGDANPFADCDALADGTEPLPRCDGVSAEALVHGVLKRRLPGPGTVIVAHALTYAGQAHVGDELMATVTVTDKQAPDRVVLACQVRRGEDVLVDGHVTVTSAPGWGVEVSPAWLDRSSYAEAALETFKPSAYGALYHKGGKP